MTATTRHPHRPGFIERWTHHVSHWVGSVHAFSLALLTIVVWAVTGPLFGFSDTWQLVINTGTTVVTFLMVFLIQRAQNKDSAVIQIKLNEILAALEGASNRLINIEDLSEGDVRDLHKRYQRLVEKACCKGDVRGGHSVEEVKAGAARQGHGRGAGI